MKADLHKNKIWILYVIVVLLAMSVAFMIGFRSVGERKQEYSDSHTTLNSNSLQTDRSLEEIFDSTRFESRFARTLYLLDLFKSTTIDELKSYWQQSFEHENSSLQEDIQRHIIARFTVLNSEQALTFVLNTVHETKRPELIEIVFGEWSLLDLEGAKRNLYKLDQNSQEVALASIVRSREDLSFAQMRELASDFDLEWVAFNVAAQYPNKTMFTDAKDEWYRFLKLYDEELNDLNESHSKTLMYLAYFWIRLKGVGAVDSIIDSLPDGFSIESVVEFVARRLQHNLPDLAIELVLSQLDGEQLSPHRELTVELFLKWMEIEPIKALQATMTIGALSFRRELQIQMLETIAQIDAYSLLKNMPMYL